MPPIEDPGTRRITNKFLDLFILANLEFEPMNNLVTTTSAERFIDYLYHAAKNDLMRIERIFRDRGIVGDSDIQVNTEKKIRSDCVDIETMAFHPKCFAYAKLCITASANLVCVGIC